MMHGTRGRLRQRADYTHKFNAGSGRHGWLRLTPAYSVKVVEETIERYGTPCRVLDPFCGTGTTALSAVNRGHDAATVDVNPFLTWLACAKTARYSADSLAEAERAAGDALDLVRREDVVPAAEPRIHRIERWWPEDSRRFLCRLKAAILRTADKSGPVSDLLHAAFCRTLIKLSNAAFNHQSMSFRAGPQCRLDLGAEGGSTFLDDLRFVLKGAAENPPAAALAVQGDARDLPSYLDARFDLVVTSPPYANRMVLYPGAAPVHVLARVSEGRARRGRAGLARHRRNVGRRDEPARGLVAERRLLASGRPRRRGREHRVPRQRERGAARELRLEVLRGHVSALRRAAAGLAPGSAYSLHRGKFHVLRRSRSDGADLCRDAPGVRIRRSTGAGAGFRIGRTRTCPASPVRTRLAA